MKPSEALESHRKEIRDMVLNHGMRNPRVFGSVLHGTDTEASDLDIVVDPGKRTSLLDVIRLERHLSEFLNIKVDILLPSENPGKVAKLILQEAVTI